MSPLRLVSEWMPGGELTKYIEKNPDANRIALVGVPPSLFDPLFSLSLQVCDIAEGLYYLHSRNVLHGDLKGVRN